MNYIIKSVFDCIAYMCMGIVIAQLIMKMLIS